MHFSFTYVNFGGSQKSLLNRSAGVAIGFDSSFTSYLFRETGFIAVVKYERVCDGQLMKESRIWASAG